MRNEEGWGFPFDLQRPPPTPIFGGRVLETQSGTRTVSCPVSSNAAAVMCGVQAKAASGG